MWFLMENKVLWGSGFGNSRAIGHGWGENGRKNVVRCLSKFVPFFFLLFYINNEGFGILNNFQYICFLLYFPLEIKQENLRFLVSC